MTKITRHSFGFPMNITKEIDIGKLDEIKKMNLINKNIHLKINIDTLKKKSYDSDVIAKEIKTSTNAERVKISFIYDNESLERSKEIADQNTAADKFKIYAKLNEMECPESVLNKISDIEDNADLKLITPSDSFTLEYVSIRGAIGIMDRNPDRKDFEIDFTNFDDGITIITGKLGAGKTTIIENCHPYPQMLTRSGALKDHFCLKDSHRILIYRDSSGKRYKITMQIDGAAKCIGTIYTVEVKNPDSDYWEALKSVDGSHDSYLEWCINTFGSLSIFLRTAFFPKEAVKSVPSLKSATKGDKMELFSILAGTDYLTTIKEKAKEKKDEIIKEINRITSQLDNYKDIENKIEQYSNIIASNTELIESNKKELDRDLTELSDYEKKQEEYIAMVNSYDLYRTSLKEASQEHQTLEAKIVQHQNNISGLTDCLKDFDSLQKEKDEYNSAVEQKKELIEQRVAIANKCNQLQSDLGTIEADYSLHEGTLQSLLIKKVETESEIKRLKSSRPKIDKNCPVCGAPLESHKIEELENEIDCIDKSISENKKALGSLLSEIETEKSIIEKFDIGNLKNKYREANKNYTTINTQIQTLDNFCQQIDIIEITNILNNTESQIANEEAIVKELKAQDENAVSKITEFSTKLQNLPPNYSDKIVRLKRGIDYLKEELTRLTTEKTISEKELANLDVYKSQISSIQQQVKAMEEDANEYELIQTAFGNNGIQALELDSAAPEIASIANAILYETYSDRFTISFDTQRTLKNKKKVIDDFIINVFDADSGRMKRLDLISSGETALITQALYYAFSVIRARRTGFCFRTRFLDESDGSIDPETRTVYLKMIESAHKHCNAKQTILITHSSEIKELVEQRIEL